MVADLACGPVPARSRSASAVFMRHLRRSDGATAAPTGFPSLAGAAAAAVASGVARGRGICAPELGQDLRTPAARPQSLRDADADGPIPGVICTASRLL